MRGYFEHECDRLSEDPVDLFNSWKELKIMGKTREFSIDVSDENLESIRMVIRQMMPC